MQDSYAIGLDIGGTNIRIGARKRDQSLEFFEKHARIDVIHGPGAGSSIARLIQEYCQRHSLDGRVAAVVLGFPSTLSADRRTVLQTPNIRDMDMIAMADILERETGLNVYLERDVNLIFEWDTASRHLDMEGVSVGIYFGTGIGNAIFINGQPLAGADGCVGEIGHIPVPGRYERCGCGNLGCTECYASGTRLSDICSSQFPGTAIAEIFTHHRGEAVIRQFIDEMACVVATEVNLLNPAFIILGGGLPAMADFPVELLEKQIREHCRKPLPEQALRIYYSQESQQGGVLGALSIAWKKMEA